MLLAIGDVVRVRSDKSLGTVAGVAAHRSGNVVDLQMNGNILRPVRPADIEVVARGFKPMTSGRALATLLFLVLGIAAAVANGHYVRDLGANWATVVFVSFTSLTTVTGGLMNVFNRPRRVRV
ncbi:hypothetical protein [Streptomyces himalayensis]|uniref:Uncharacterized protein n=1 Tax=Streptomyces himalayensis subsp. himalayensis TaxID=2756131 RepID=A0A7W0DHG2_9ACTN|nr:hypothetical protein [Streptomyces himalayensis]MBA2945112.1 hypothetical protein [Streptomyces himalayensis subsp. himalayensis]